MEDVLFKEPDSLVCGTASGSTTKQLFLERKPRILDKSLSLMSAAGVTDGASGEVETIAKLHSLIIVDPSEPEEEPSQPTHGDANPFHSSPPISKPERRNLRVDTRLSHVLCPPSPVVVESGNRLSTTTTTSASASEPDVEETVTKRAIRSTTSLPSFHLPHRTRSISYREMSSDTQSLTSASLSSLTSGNSPMSLNSGLCTPPHSPSGYALVHTEITTPPSSHLSPISELRRTEDRIERLFLQTKEGNSTQTVMRTRTERPGSSSAERGESDGQGQGQAIGPLDVPSAAPHAAYTHVHHSNSPTSTVIGLVLHHSSPTPMSTNKQLPTPPSVSPSPPPPSPLLSLPRSTGRAWPFGVGIHNRASARTNAVLSQRNSSSSSKADKAEKAAAKKRKKAEARAQNEKLALELKKKQKARADETSVCSSGSGERIMSPRSWEEDIAIYGSLASM